MNPGDTIVAAATGVGASPRAIIRTSGPAALAIAADLIGTSVTPGVRTGPLRRG
jgi:tRNA U34 5-carboxymethylaminomethyl modifying GTPase MnmE/TrmE